MRWTVFAIMVYLAFAAQEGLRTLLVVGHTSPNFLLVMFVFVAMHAPRLIVAWAAVAVGLVADLQPLPQADQLADVAVIGPGCLGYLAAGFVVIHLRVMVFRESTMATAALVVASGLFFHLIVVALLTMRGLAWPLGEPIRGWNAADQLVHRFLEVMYSAVWAVPIAAGLLKIEWLWGFPHHSGGARRHPTVRGGR